MFCPRCNNVLEMSNTQGVEIDYCPNCRGVWLDRGELEKVIERSNTHESQYMRDNEHYSQNEVHYNNAHDSHQNYGSHSKHKKGFLSEIFDF